MPKPVFTTLICVALFHSALLAQDTRKVQKTDSGWLVTTYTRSGSLETKALYADDSLKVLKGEVLEYYKNGVLRHLSTYADGKRNGPEIFYHENGKILEKGDNKDDKHEGPWIGYYPSGKLAGTAIYTAGKETEVKLLEEDGSKKSEKVFEREADFPGGPKGWLAYMSKNLRYPDYDVNHNIQGIVIVEFKTTKTGKIVETMVIKGVEKRLDAEAHRIIRESPDWEPAIAAGQPAEAYHKQPIVFKLEGPSK